MKTKIATTLAVALLAGCGPDKLDCRPGPGPNCQAPQAYQQAPQQYAQPAPVPVVVQQAAPAHSGMQDMLVGGAIGALATHALTSRSAPAAPAPAPVTNTRIIERTVVVRQAPPRVLPAVPVAPRPSFTAPAPRPRLSYTPPSRVVPSYKVSTTKRK